MEAEVKIQQAVAILIDGNNLEIEINNQLGSNVMLNFDAVVPRLLEQRSLTRLIYFREGKIISQKLAERLKNKFHGSVQPCFKSADVPLAIKAVQLAPKIDTLIILSGDSDFVELVLHLKCEGVRVEVGAFLNSASPHLISAADRFHEITERDCFAYNG